MAAGKALPKGLNIERNPTGTLAPSVTKPLGIVCPKTDNGSDNLNSAKLFDSVGRIHSSLMLLGVTCSPLHARFPATEYT